jgi:hypothetical protein
LPISLTRIPDLDSRFPNVFAIADYPITHFQLLPSSLLALSVEGKLEA